MESQALCYERGGLDGPDAGTDGGICAAAADLAGDGLLYRSVVVVCKGKIVDDKEADGDEEGGRGGHRSLSETLPLRRCRCGRSSTTRPTFPTAYAFPTCGLILFSSFIHPRQLYHSALPLVDQPAHSKITRFHRREDACRQPFAPSFFSPSHANHLPKAPWSVRFSPACSSANEASRARRSPLLRLTPENPTL